MMSLSDTPELIHPCDFFRLRERSIVPDTCFVLMPFGEDMLPVYQTIDRALDSVGVKCNRADTQSYAGTILHNVMQNISSAELIIADLTDRNANVFYELGLAHVRTRDVILIASKPTDVPFNLNSLRCHFYGRNLSGLRQYVLAQTAKIRGQRVPSELRDRMERTRQIVEYLRRMRTTKTRRLVIRQQAAMSSFSNAGPLPSDPPEKSAYYKLLAQERSKMVKCLRAGATFQLIVSPLAPKPYGGKRWWRRANVLAALLEDHNLTHGKLDIAMMPYTTQNLLFIGDEILFEGHKTSVLEGGFQLTSVHTNRQQVTSRANIFSTLFASACEYTRHELGCANNADSRRKAIARYLRDNLK